jgi:hypothetical protein
LNNELEKEIIFEISEIDKLFDDMYIILNIIDKILVT